MSDRSARTRGSRNPQIPLDDSGDPIRVLDAGEYESTATAVITAVSEVSDCEALDVPPLYDTVDPDALDKLAATGTVEIQFSFAGCQIEVSRDEVRVCKPQK
jgi:hypothetical protein